MSKLRYFIQKHITISEFAKLLAIPSLDVELDDSPTNFYPYFRLTLGTTKMAITWAPKFEVSEKDWGFR